LYGQGFPKSMNLHKASDGEIPEGLGTALKPANEPICLARKPLSEKTVAKNVLKHGTGGLNIDAGRISLDEGVNLEAKQRSQTKQDGQTVTLNVPGHEQSPYNAAGRFPSNVILDEGAAEVLDGQSGVTIGSGKAIVGGTPRKTKGHVCIGSPDRTDALMSYGDSGGASRFFYVAKASKSDRGEGNIHPTVKPVKLMEYLIKLVTPTGGIVLDPFMGSGTTGVAAKRLDFGFVGIEMTEEYFNIAKSRIEGVKEGDDG
jgi:site-specific DNA-methyltransferase (adenine-specific)